MSMQTQQPTQGAPRWMKITLVLSLAANLAVVGLVAGFALRGPIWQPQRDGMAVLTNGLPPGHVQAMRAELREHGDMLRDGLRGQRDMIDQLVQALRAEPFVLEDFAAVLAAQRDRVSQLQAVGHEALIARIAGMTDDERDAYAEALSKGPRPGRGRNN